jgi:hypothetical protein
MTAITIWTPTEPATPVGTRPVPIAAPDLGREADGAAPVPLRAALLARFAELIRFGIIISLGTVGALAGMLIGRL